MTKLLIFFGLFFGILYFFYYKLKKFLLNITGQFEDTTDTQSASNELRVDKGKMIKCPVCGVYFPENTGIKKRLVAKKLYCSQECATKGE
jgi:Pyruvate/2-oxoacid:ferredoxin oxidoreductase delta subunit